MVPAAYEAIDYNRQIPIGPQDVASPYLLSDLLVELWRTLKLINKKQTVQKTLLFQNLLHGSDLMEIVNGVAPFKHRTALVRDSGGWIEIMPEIEIVLFCNGLGDVIAPKDPHDACRFMSSVPEGHDFLCTTIACLKHLSERAASSEACEVLAEGCFWHSPGLFFSPCTCDYNDRGNCDPFQQIVKVKNRIFGKNRVSPPDKPAAEGAIIFGKRTRDLAQQEATKPQNAGFANEVEQSKQQIRQADNPDEQRNMQNSRRIQEQPRLRRCAKNENLRTSINQPNYFQQDQRNT